MRSSTATYTLCKQNGIDKNKHCIEYVYAIANIFLWWKTLINCKTFIHLLWPSLNCNSDLLDETNKDSVWDDNTKYWNALSRCTIQMRHLTDSWRRHRGARAYYYIHHRVINRKISKYEFCKQKLIIHWAISDFFFYYQFVFRLFSIALSLLFVLSYARRMIIFFYCVSLSIKLSTANTHNSHCLGCDVYLMYVHIHSRHCVFFFSVDWVPLFVSLSINLAMRTVYFFKFAYENVHIEREIY